MPIDVYRGLAAIGVLSFWGSVAGLGGYKESKRLSQFDELTTMILGLILAFGLVLAGAFFIRSISLSRLVVGYAGIIALFSLILTRTSLRRLMGWLRSQGYGIRHVLWIGQNPLLDDVLDRLQRSPQIGFHLIGQVLPDQEQKLDPTCQQTSQTILTPTANPTVFSLTHLDRSPQTVPIPVVTELDHLCSYLQTHPQIKELWFAQPELATTDLFISLQCLDRSDLQIRLLPDILAFMTVNLTLQSLDGIPLLTLQETPLRSAHHRMLKRLLDVVGSALGLVLLSPILILIAISVYLSNPGPIFYQQERISLDGQHFWIYKFRTMVIDAETNQQPGWTRPNDPRRTPIGAFLRRFNLDELPQLWNVLKGEMSLVGPRPERPYYVQQFSQAIPKYLDRHLVKTGLTGWAQIHGLRGDTSISRRTQYDLYYVHNWSLLLDLRIISITLWQAITGQIEGY